MSESDQNAPAAPPTREIKTRFPVARIKRLMQSDDDIGKVAQATPIVVAKALELFMISLVDASCEQARMRNSKRVTPSHLKQAVMTTEHFDFLADSVAKYPDPVTAPVENQSEEDAPPTRRRGRKREE
ncbi:negative cofactor 2 complex subunit alpha [Trichomonascus vanleenenianus]|uniref:negative cofactor 2 complex subunit alpha n=1 Tax=Trichomonascus vanleenenianus TaxID=2268995 RepID=UPI003EC9EFD8